MERQAPSQVQRDACLTLERMFAPVASKHMVNKMRPATMGVLKEDRNRTP